MMENKIFEVRAKSPKGAPCEGWEFRYIVSAKNEESIQKIIDNYTKRVFGRNDRIREVVGAYEISPGTEAVMNAEEWNGWKFYLFEPENEEGNY